MASKRRNMFHKNKTQETTEKGRMHAAIERNSWRLPPEEIVQVADPRSKKVQELVYPGSGEGRNWRSVVFSLLVIAAVIAGILVAIYTLGWVDELLYWSGRRMDLQEYLQADLDPDRLPPAWTTPTHFIFQADDGGLSVYNASSDNVTQLVANHTIRHLNVKWFQGSSDLRYVLLRHSVKQVFRHTFTALYTIYDVTNDHQIPVRLTESPSSVRSGGKPSDRRRLQGAWWCGNTTSLVLVSNNDLYFRNSPAEQIDHRITFNGEPDILYNGVPDWLYQEEILGGDRSCAWCSDDGSHLMYTQFNDTLVRTFAYPWLGVNSPQSNKRPSTFPTTTTVRYPTPGTPNPTVRLLLANLTDLDQPHIELKPPPIFDNQEYYLTSAGWVNRENTKISAVWINRSQNVSVISYCVAPDWICRETHSERAAENGWIDIQSHPVFSEDGGSFLVMAQVQEGETDVYTHIKHITLKQQRIAVISHGRYQVTNILSWDYVNHLVYYLGSHETRPGQKHMYVVKDPATDEPLRTQPECITCDLNHYLKHSAHLYTNCTYFSAFIPPLLFNDVDGVTRYVLECDGPGLPVAGVHNSYDHRLVRQLFSSRAELGERLAELALPKQRTFEVPLAHGNRAQVQLLLPPSWREELRDAAYPVLVHIDGRPGSESVSERYNIDWGTYMSSRFDIVYVKLDVGGSIGRGSKAINRRVGSTSQLQHYLTAIRYLLDKHKFFDRTRIAVWGRGYGGYITIRALSSQHTLFKCGIAISPIAEWLYYNSAFTERILGLPSDNYKLYVEADAFQRTKHIENMALYLVHGLADISVPYVHSAALTTSLTDQGVLFRYQSYADQGHDLTGVLEHLYKSMEEFLSQCLNLDRNE